MSKSDSDEFRILVCQLLPGLRILEVARPSGQRIVYFGDFADLGSISDEAREAWGDTDVQDWGDVVVKVSSGIGANAITYLQREIRVLNGLNSDSYPKMLFDSVYTQDPETDENLDERLFVTVEKRVPSVPLSDRMGDYRSEAATVDLLIRLANALRLLWDQKPPLVHRDIKPDNILVKDDDSIVVIDLGIVREQGAAGVTKTEWLWGPCTPHFSSPEQARNDKRNISFKSDVFALGTLSHVLLTDSNPFKPNDDTSVTDVLDNVVNLQPPSLADVADVSQDFSNLVGSMMQKEPYLRPRTPDALITSLIQIQEQNNAD